MARVWVTGDAVVDLIPDSETSYLKCPGGAPANVAVAIARLGGDSSFFGRVGQDPLGRFMKQVLKDEGVDTIVKAIQKGAKTGNIGDGKIFIYPIDNVIRIRTGEEGDSAV